ncbi:hypothetical protein Rsub_08919 [Raphidocelis subcapitata]|uniref:Uncharacterized protein n=1 Tax=Raphidocelis subcapitata TaxID=307507 RepID=A0A2V0P8I0_9CHLO|nr:hypothetical protein Rsub_08919 [Raphidocelis subcapitata]|eukprot:GBF96171.1 hypothetical protein Rsub_08919 [Raphidocelis subcapitata]
MSGAEAGAGGGGAGAAAAPPSTPPAAPAPAPAPAAAPPTPLEQRQWRRGAQTGVRVAVTTAKSARARGAEASAAGTRAITALTNALLEAAYLPTRPLGLLAEAPGFAEAARRKLLGRAERALRELEGCWQRLAEAAEELRAAADGVSAHPADARWQRGSPVFSALPLPRAAALLRGVAEAAAREAEAKRRLVTALASLVRGSGGGGGSAHPGGSSGQGGGGGDRGAGAGGGAGAGAEALRERLTVAIASWLARPFVDDEAADAALATLTEDMAGF